MQQLREKERICERNNTEDTKVSVEGEGGTGPGSRAETSLQPMVTQIALLLWRTPRWSRLYPEGRYYLMECLHGKWLLVGAVAPWRGVHARAGLLTGPFFLWVTHTGAVSSWRTAHHEKNTHWSSSQTTEPHGKVSCWRKPWRTVSYGKDSILEQGNNVRKKDQQKHVMTAMDNLSPLLLGGR